MICDNCIHKDICEFTQREENFHTDLCYYFKSDVASEWEIQTKGLMKHTCKNCGYCVPVYLSHSYNYCENCGVKMKGES